MGEGGDGIGKGPRGRIRDDLTRLSKEEKKTILRREVSVN